jgi:hypothetical protein
VSDEIANSTIFFVWLYEAPINGVHPNVNGLIRAKTIDLSGVPGGSLRRGRMPVIPLAPANAKRSALTVHPNEVIANGGPASPHPLAALLEKRPDIGVCTAEIV